MILTALGLAAAAPVRAQNALASVEAAGEKLTSIEASFTHVKTIKASGKSSTFTGTCYYKGPDKMAMIYEQESEGLVLNGKDFFVRRGGKAHKGDINKVKQMGQLSSILFSCIRGHAADVATEHNATLTTKKEKGSIVATMTAKKKSSKGFSKIILRYRQSDGMLEYIRMEEFSGTTNEYTLTGQKSGVTIPADRFTIPKK